MLREFIDARLAMWRRLEELVAEVGRNRLTRLGRAEVRELAHLYRRTAADLAIAREEVRDPVLANYLNGLVGRAHGAIYRNEGTGFRAFADFFRYEFPAVFRRTIAYTATAFAVTLLFAAIAAVTTSADERFADHIVGGVRQDIIAHRNWTDRINESNPVHSALIQQNNISVSAMAFGGGVLFGLGTLYILMVNGLMLGTILYLCVRYEFHEILVFISGHGVVELTAIFIAGGAGLLLARALIAPGDTTRLDALVEKGREAVILMLGCAAMLVIAGLIEGFISPARIAPAWKLATSAATAVLLVLYLATPDRRHAGPDGR